VGRANGRTALVTGSSRGIGRATAVKVSRDGVLVAVHYAENQTAAEETVTLIEKDGGRAFAVNTVAPGNTDNGNPVFGIPEVAEQLAQMSAFKRVAKTDDVANVVAFLASAEARWITGALIDATGGTLLG
jgi:NAD(P)-dependent dehydrogenase (short-subunit alcohol dehydrogenase family)